ncbi:hypothetical protein CUV01_14785 [Paracoccus tegillarcae]|uniref:Uncharacterized protein n=1 Tax=Paracoccus tegillarcae TaxID=1529068 RepID=A0A2K9EYU1_9RHOB|nr:hypothetical protein CUV01_14785 [Paracoccus tegillarcae]
MSDRGIGCPAIADARINQILGCSLKFGQRGYDSGILCRFALRAGSIAASQPALIRKTRSGRDAYAGFQEGLGIF